jgi:hypothetical protein
MTLTVFPVISQNAQNTELTIKYAQQFDDASQGLNNTKGTILRVQNSNGVLNPSPHFGLVDMTLEIEIPGDNDGDNSNGDGNDDGDGDNTIGCKCDKNTGTCLCGSSDGVGCGCTHDESIKILSDNVHYLVLEKPFVFDLEAEGGTTPYTWSVKDRTLPEGLTFTEDGIVEGVPEVLGSFRVTIQVSDSEEKVASKRFTFLVVEDEKLAIMTDTLPEAQVGMFYTARVRSGGGTKPYTWTVNNLPSWLSFDPDSAIFSGTPGEAAIHDLTARVEDVEGSTDAKLFRLSVYPHDGLSITTRILPAAIYEKDYAARLEVSGGIPPHVFTLQRGSALPPGLELNNDGTLSGKLSRKGTYSFVIDAMDGNGLQGSASYTMAVLSAETLAPSHDDFAVKEYEGEKRILLEFSLSRDFDSAKILNVEALASPDSYIADSNSTITKEQNGYRVRLTLHVADNALNNGWIALLENLTLEGITVKFQDASGEEIQFKKSLLVQDLRKEEKPDDRENSGDSSGGGGCNAGWSASLSSLLLTAVLRTRKRAQ